MKKTALFICLLITQFALYGQNFSDNIQVKWGEKHKFKKLMSLSEVIAHDETGYLVETRKYLHSNPRSPKFPFLEKYDKNTNLVKSVDLSKYDLPGKPSFRKLITWNNQLWIFYTTDPGDNKEAGLYRIAIDPKNLTLQGESHFLLSSSKSIVKPSFNPITIVGLEKTKSIFHIFPDKKQGKLLIVHQDPETEKKQKLVTALVLDNQFIPLLKQDENIHAMSGNFWIEDAILDSNGNVHLLSVDVIDNGVINYREKSFFSVISIPANGGQVLHKKLNLGEQNLAQAKIAANKEGHLFLGGFYTEENYNKSVAGTYLLKMDGNNQQLIQQKMEPFEKEFLISGLKNSKAKKVSKKLDKGNQLEDSMFYLDQIMVKDNGNVTLLGEERSSYRFTVDNSIKTRYVFGSIAVAEFDADGNKIWVKKIVKDQSSSNGGNFYFSYSVNVINNNLYLIYNDQEKNLSYNGDGSVEEYDPGSVKKPAISLIKIDEEGNLSKKSLSFADDRRLLNLPRVNTLVGTNEMIIYGEIKKKYRLAKVTFGSGMVASE